MLSDEAIIFYNKDNNEYKKDYSISTNGINGPIIQTKDNDIYKNFNIKDKEPNIY